jgi:hypothetical protein
MICLLQPAASARGALPEYQRQKYPDAIVMEFPVTFSRDDECLKNVDKE